MTAKKAERELRLSLRETKDAEDDVIFHQRILGDALKDIRLANGVTQQTVAERMAIDLVRVQTMETICSVENAIKFWCAVMNDPAAL